MTKQKPYILVTGGAGYIGSHTCKMLAQQGYTPVAFDNLSNGHSHAVKWGPLIQGDLLDAEVVKLAFDEYDFSAVIHFASYIEVGESVNDPEKYYRNNIGGTINLLHAMREKHIQNIIFSSSCALYGAPENLPITEDTPKNPLSPYGRTKYIIEQILEDYAHAYDLHYVCCRYFNACGADLEGEIGEEHEPESHLIPRLLMAAAGDITSMELYGTDYDTKDGTCIRDYIHVQDLARAHVLSLQYLENKSKSCAVNLGTGSGFSVREIIDTVMNVTGKKITINEKPRRPGDPPILVADTQMAYKTLGFRTEINDLEDITRSAWNFLLNKKSPN